MKKVVSIALFGSGKDGSGMSYGVYLYTFILAHLNLFPQTDDWELRVHIDDEASNSPNGRLLEQAAMDGLLTFVVMNDPPIRCKAMLWRMLPVFDEAVDYTFLRDLDALPMPRDRLVCDHFISSQCAVHTVHDSQSHAGIMGGLCGFRGPAFRLATGLRSLADVYRYAALSDEAWAQHGADQHVLARIIDRPGGPPLLEHRYSGWAAARANVSPPREGSKYHCTAYSALMPNRGWSKTDDETISEEADTLANHLGSAGYDHERARRFWEEKGDPEITRRLRECLK